MAKLSFIRVLAAATLLSNGCQTTGPAQGDTSQTASSGVAATSPSANSSSPSGSAGAATARPTTPATNSSAAPAGDSSSAGNASRPAANSGAAGDSEARTRPAANSGSAGSAGSAGTPENPAAAGTAAPPTSGTSTLPEVTDFKTAGPFTPKREAGPAGYQLFYPEDLGKDGVKHPILSWGPGAAETASDFSVMLQHLASHGFAVISFDATPQGQELVTGMDWMLMENTREGSVFYQKLDETKISAGGHSAGSLATFVIGGDKRLVTTLHISGGTFDPHTDIMNLHAPTLFVCGEPGGDGLLVGDVAHPNCEIDFENAAVPVFYGITKGASHMTPTDIGDAALRTHQLGAMVGWLRWQLAGDTAAKDMFVGDACTLCSDAAWSTAKSKNLD
jgi:hypothetical protein